VDVAARDVACGFIGDALLQFAATGIAPRRTGNDAPQIAPHNVYPCAGEDSWVSIVVSTDTEWRAFASALERPSLLTDPRFATARGRWAHRRELDTEISAWTHAQTREAVTRILRAAGVAAFPSCRPGHRRRSISMRLLVKSMVGPDGQSRKSSGRRGAFHARRRSSREDAEAWATQSMYSVDCSASAAEIGAHRSQNHLLMPSPLAGIGVLEASAQARSYAGNLADLGADVTPWHRR
jgi:crotonobetainyl-CoA:carnitine CoA-transferase CaiB-like acyl-CoA transferase